MCDFSSKPGLANQFGVVGNMRAHQQLFPADTLFWEQINPPGVELRDGLTARGYNWQAQPAPGDI